MRKLALVSILCVGALLCLAAPDAKAQYPLTQLIQVRNADGSVSLLEVPAFTPLTVAPGYGVGFVPSVAVERFGFFGPRVEVFSGRERVFVDGFGRVRRLR
jgi:hypothetical protein